MIKAYYRLTKPRMVFTNVLVAAAAFIFASQSSFGWQTFGLMILGLACIVASACVFNNYADRGIDARMERTQKRPLVTGQINPAQALWFGILLVCAGILLLLQVNVLALGAALVGFVVYICIYTPMKPRTGYALFPGAVAGAMPPVVGYAAAANTLDLMALALFAFLFLWQVPHFLAIARYRWDEYAAAGVPLLVERPTSEKARHQARMIFYTSLVVLLLVCFALMLQRYTR